MRAFLRCRRLVLVLLLALAGCDNGWTKEDELLARPLLRLPGDNIYTIASAPDGSVFVSTFGGHVYRRMPRADAWTRVGLVVRLRR